MALWRLVYQVTVQYVASELLELDGIDDTTPRDSGERIFMFSMSVPKLVIALVVGRGDMQPFIAIAKRLQEFGHHVMATHAYFHSFVKSSGVEYYPLGGDPRIMAGSIDAGSVVSMVDRITSSTPGNGSTTAVGEDLVAMTKCRLQACNFMLHDVGVASKKMKRHTSAMPLNNAGSAGSVNDSFKHFHGLESSELESITISSLIKRFKS